MSDQKRKPRLHELLAVEMDRKGAAEKARKTATDRFTRKTAHFSGVRRTFRPFSVDEAAGESPDERLEAETRLVATVPEVLEGIFGQFGQALDVSFQIDDANTRARADLVVDGQTLAEQVPATFLLQLEKRLRSMKELLEAAPTYDPVKLWTLDAGADKAHVFRAEPVVTVRKQKTRKYNIMVEATKEHPAQVDIVNVDAPVGQIRTYEWTGMLSPGRKAQLLERMDKLILAVKAARSRANTQDVDPQRRIAKTLADYVLAPLGR